MNIIDHGKWVLYRPEKLPDGIPSSVLFARRESDGVDWYEFSRNAASLQPHSVKFIAREQDTAGWVIGVATRDVSTLFPANAIVCEITDYEGVDPQRELSQRIFDFKTMTIGNGPKPALPLNPFRLVYELEKRVEALEKRMG